MTVEEIIYLMEVKARKELKLVDKFILRQGWQGKTYTDMANSSHYGEHYLRKSASFLWKSLSEIFCFSITKTNFRIILQQRPLTDEEQLLIEAFYSKRLSEKKPQFPGSPVSLWSQFYIERPPIEELAYAEVAKLGSVIRIKAPRKMGKNSLLLRIVDYGHSLRYRSVCLDFQQAEIGKFETLDKFLRWFCATVTVQLGLPPKLEMYWDETIGSKMSATLYFQGYLLPWIQVPLILGLNEVNILFQYPAIASEFLPMLRSWHEEAKQVEIWQRLRLIVVYSTEIYIPLNLNQSPFNIGLPIKLPEFTLEQVDQLAEIYQLPLQRTELKKLMATIGGHPYLIRLAFHHLTETYPISRSSSEKKQKKQPYSAKQLKLSLEQLLKTAHTQTGIYRDHLRSLRATLYDRPELLAAFKQVLTNDEPVMLPDILAYKLESLGLVKIDGNLCNIRCKLYSLYFSEQLLLENNSNLALSTNTQWNLLKELAKYKQAFDDLIHRDSLTGFMTQRYFKKQIEQKWLECQGDPVSVLICNIDFLHIYNQIHDNEATDNCLQQVAGAIGQVVQQPSELIGRLSEAKFGVFLPGKTTEQTQELSQQICQQVAELAIAHENVNIDGLPEIITVSIGVASAIASQSKTSETNVKMMLNAAEKATIQAKQLGGNQVVVSEVDLLSISNSSASS